MGRKVLIYGASYRDLRPWEIDSLFEEFGDGISWYQSKPASHGAYRLVYNAVRPDVVYLTWGHAGDVARGFFRHMVSETKHCFFAEEAGAGPMLMEITEVTLGGLISSRPYTRQ